MTQEQVAVALSQLLMLADAHMHIYIRTVSPKNRISEKDTGRLVSAVHCRLVRLYGLKKFLFFLNSFVSSVTRSTYGICESNIIQTLHCSRGTISTKCTWRLDTCSMGKIILENTERRETLQRHFKKNICIFSCVRRKVHPCQAVSRYTGRCIINTLAAWFAVFFPGTLSLRSHQGILV